MGCAGIKNIVITMDILDIRELCMELPCTEETLPFDETTLVYKVAGKMFAITDMEQSDRITLKCDPDKGIMLRDSYDEIAEAYHMNKKHWITVWLNGDLPSELIRELVRESYANVVAKLPLKQRQQLQELLDEYSH